MLRVRYFKGDFEGRPGEALGFGSEPFSFFSPVQMVGQEFLQTAQVEHLIIVIPQIAIAIGVLTSNRGGGRRTTFAVSGIIGFLLSGVYAGIMFFLTLPEFCGLTFRAFEVKRVTYVSRKKNTLLRVIPTMTCWVEVVR